jgi:hypothetical protein
VRYKKEGGVKLIEDLDFQRSAPVVT